MEISRRRETTQVAADSSLVSDKRTYSLVNDNENMPRRGNRCDIVSGWDLPEIFRRLGHVSVIYAKQMCGDYYLIRAGNDPDDCRQQLCE